MDQPRETITLDWGAAAATILARLDPDGRTVIGVTGPVGAGKSTLAGQLAACVVRTDDYLPDYDTVPYDERDDPRHADLELLATHLRELRAGRVVDLPVWSHVSHRREGSRRCEPAGVIVCEGIHAMHEPVMSVLDLRVYVHAPATTRLARWERIEREGERGWGVDAARAFFHDVAEPTFGRHAEAFRSLAHVIVINDARPSD